MPLLCNIFFSLTIVGSDEAAIIRILLSNQLPHRDKEGVLQARATLKMHAIIQHWESINRLVKWNKKSKMWNYHLKCPVLLDTFKHTATERLARHFQYAVSFKVPVSTTGIMLTYSLTFRKLYTFYIHANVSTNKEWPLPWTELQTCFQKETLSSRVRDSSLIVSSQNTKMQLLFTYFHLQVLTPENDAVYVTIN